MPELSSRSVRPTAINLPMLLQLNIATNCASGKTITINPAISFIGSIINCGRSAWRRILPVAMPYASDTTKKKKIISGTMPLINGEGMTVC